MDVFACCIDVQKSIFDNQYINFLKKFDAVALDNRSEYTSINIYAFYIYLQSEKSVA